MMSLQEIAIGTAIAAAFCSVLRYVIKSDTTAIVNGKIDRMRSEIQEHGNKMGRMEEHIDYLDERVVNLEKYRGGRNA